MLAAVQPFVVPTFNVAVLVAMFPTFRPQDPVQEWKVPGGDSRVLTTQVSFNRKNAFLLASAQVNQVYIWDSRWVSFLFLPCVDKTLGCLLSRGVHVNQ